MQIIDLSKTVKDNPKAPFFLRIKIKKNNRSRVRWMVRALGLPFKLMPKDFDGWADETIKKLGVHATTHIAVSYTHLRAHETVLDLVCRLPLEKKKL